jgi:chorismate dehydratase
MSVIRLGAVGYLNARPLVHGLDRRADRFAVQFAVPSACAALLHAGRVDLGLIPSIEYLSRVDYLIVPDIGIVSEGPVQSVALFTRRRVSAIRSIAVDSSSRASVALLRVLCATRFGIHPEFMSHQPDLPAMLERADAALLIGDEALFLDTNTHGVSKIDLGTEWTQMTGLPFVYAFWAGRQNVVDKEAAAALQNARREGIAAIDQIARDYTEGDPADSAKAAAYLRENITFDLGERERAGLRRFFELAASLRIVDHAGELRFY